MKRAGYENRKIQTEKRQRRSLNFSDIWWNSFGNPADPAVLMIMGLNSNSKVWSEKYIQELVDNDLHVIIFDNRDIGKSTWVTEEPRLISFIKILPNFLKEYFVELSKKNDGNPKVYKNDCSWKYIELIASEIVDKAN